MLFISLLYTAISSTLSWDDTTSIWLDDTVYYPLCVTTEYLGVIALIYSSSVIDSITRHRWYEHVKDTLSYVPQPIDDNDWLMSGAKPTSTIKRVPSVTPSVTEVSIPVEQINTTHYSIDMYSTVDTAPPLHLNTTQFYYTPH